MMKRFLKALICISLLAVMVLPLFSCGQAKVADSNGGWEGISWDFKDGTLSITGSGSMPSAASSDKVGWASVRTGVKKVVFFAKDSQPITTIGDYAFYGMQNLTEITLPDGITSIGKAAFAFCSSLKSINLPEVITTVGESAFEGCVALENVTVPEAVTTLGNRAFAFCKGLKSALVAGNITIIGDWTFKNCVALDKVTVRDTFDSAKIATTAFEGAKMSAAGITKTDAIGQKIVITVKYQDTDGNQLKDSLSDETKVLGDEYSFVAPVIEGYELEGDQVAKGIVQSATIDVIFKYKKIEQTEEVSPETDTPATDTPTTTPSEDKEVDASTIIALVIFVVVIGGIVIGAVLLIRADKKQQKTGNTVRKSDKNSSKKGKRK